MAAKMAAAELKQKHVSFAEITKSNISQTISHREIECYQFKIKDLLYYIFSIFFLFTDTLTDSFAFVQYLLQGYTLWGCLSISFTIIPAGIIQLFSLRWQQSDGSVKLIHWISHILFLGVFHRYLILLYTAVYSLKNKQFVKDKKSVYRKESDICMLQLFESFMGAAPQLVLQLYIIVVLHDAPIWTSMSTMASLCSLIWAIGTYIKAMHKINPNHNNESWISLMLQYLWRGGMLTSRLTVLVLIAICLRKWFSLFLGLHWLSMTVWVILQNTDFCSTIWEERIYNCIIGLIYCFDFFNLCEGKSRYKVFAFYFIIVIENLSSLVIYMLNFKQPITIDIFILMIFFIVGGMLIGLISMLLYYTKFHPTRNLNLDKVSNENSNVIATNSIDTSRSFKQYYCGSLPQSSNVSTRSISEEVTADKQFLLTNIVQNTDCLEEGIVNEAYKIENEIKTTEHVVSKCEKSPDSSLKDRGTLSLHDKDRLIINSCPKCNRIVRNNSKDTFNVVCKCIENITLLENNLSTIHHRKRRGICLPITEDLDKEKNFAVINSDVHISSQKRRDIFSSTQHTLAIHTDTERLKSDFNHCEIPVVNSDIDLKSNTSLDSKKFCSLEETLRDISGVLNTIRNEEELQIATISHSDKDSDTTKLSKDLQQKDETMSCVTSIHDYENVCPLGVARPPWCIRSWKGYTDIETYLHDDSVVRDRRRDTLTSTTTGTTYSSDFSDGTCTSSLIRRILKQNDYLDTLTYDLVDSNELKVKCNNDLYTSSNTEEQNATLYAAKPIVIDDTGGMFSLDTIVEEHDDDDDDDIFSVTTKSIKPTCTSVSSLVSTIDQIRTSAAENSPRHIYHRTESHWGDMTQKDLSCTTMLFSDKLHDNNVDDVSFAKSLEKSPDKIATKCELNTIRELVKSCTIESIKKTPLIDAILSDSPILGNKDKILKHINGTASSHVFNSNEHDLYIEMNSLVPAVNIKDTRIDIIDDKPCDLKTIAKNRNFNVSTPISDKSVKESSTSVCSNNDIISDKHCNKHEKTINYTKKKLSLLKEKFEPKSQQLVYMVTPNNGITVEHMNFSKNSETLTTNVSIVLKKTTGLSFTHDKENLAPIATVKDNNTNKYNNVYIEESNNIYENKETLYNVQLNMKDKGHVFLEEVLKRKKSFIQNIKNL
ncbi:uncharacterized protein LOC122516492 isoform X1 [Polistes fuscatus]|uniref:uncharacterized protein LOC122516492 isoform X1 n=2 Tax=Polistes fuscatus TaxID=30207 RepID=UPI001CA81705|nr:uncharacterized protein LOC122516492 isoform X1 [Polistes fuscatus]